MYPRHLDYHIEQGRVARTEALRGFFRWLASTLGRARRAGPAAAQLSVPDPAAALATVRETAAGAVTPVGEEIAGRLRAGDDAGAAGIR